MRPLILAAFLAFTLVGCQTAPETPRQNVYAAAALYASTARTTADLLRSHTISLEQAKKIQATLHKFKPALDTAHAAVHSDKKVPADTMVQLRKMQQTLARIQQQLQQEKSSK